MLENLGFFLTIYLQQDERKVENQPSFVMTLRFEITSSFSICLAQCFLQVLGTVGLIQQQIWIENPNCHLQGGKDREVFLP